MPKAKPIPTVKHRQEGDRHVIIAGFNDDAIYHLDEVVKIRGKDRPDIYRYWTSKPWRWSCLYYDLVSKQQKNGHISQVWLRYCTWRFGDAGVVVEMVGAENTRLFIWEQHEEAIRLASDLAIDVCIPKIDKRTSRLLARYRVKTVGLLDWP